MHGKELILKQLRDLGFLTASQLGALTGLSNQMIWRHLRTLQSDGLIASQEITPDGSAGRPERVWRVVDKQSKNEPHEAFMAHTVLINWSAALGACLTRGDADLKLRYAKELSTNIAIPDSSRTLTVRPDAAFVLHSKKRQQSLLFLIEADNGTEPLTSDNVERESIAQKIEQYRFLLGLGAYGNFSKRFCYTFEGFRALFITNTLERTEQIQRLSQRMAPADFVWTSSVTELREHGLNGECWRRGSGGGMCRLFGRH